MLCRAATQSGSSSRSTLVRTGQHWAHPLNRRQCTVTAMAGKPYTLLTAGTPNGIKASIVLEELGLEYETKAIDISKNVQKEEWFLKINPNGRIPALVDHTANDLALFESGAIMYYLADKLDSDLWAKDPAERANIMSWLMFQMGGIGPMQGQANHFVAFAPVTLDYPIKRYVEETYRLYGVLDRGLEGQEYLANNKYSIADIASFAWVVAGFFAGITTEQFPNVEAWVKRIAARPAVKRGVAVPSEGPVYKGLYSTPLELDLQKRLDDGKAKYAKAVEALKA